ncbi:phosphotransferase [Marinomonas polaris]|uniref:phosphotransferase family protein n=1 Tax=Marinomonas polaris TaxID=293552 RepID=UPI003F9B7C13
MNIVDEMQKMSHSGASISVQKKEANFIVKKEIFNDLDRSLRSIEKQKNFSALITSCFKVQSIPVLSMVKIGDGVVIEMPYVEGVTGEQFAVLGNRLLASQMKTTLNSLLIDSWSKSEDKPLSKKIVLKKVSEIISSEYDDEMRESVNSACKYIHDNLKDDMQIPIGQCHGDLNMSNIIVTHDNNLYLFDFLDGIIESPLQDVAKLLQDFKYGWSFRNSKASIKLKGQLFFESSYPTIIDLFFGKYKIIFRIIEILTIIRIAPYISKEDIITKKWLIKSIEKFLGEVCE